MIESHIKEFHEHWDYLWDGEERLHEYFTEWLISTLTSTEKEAYQRGREEEARAWLAGQRCNMCGDSMESEPLTDMCAKCWREG